MEIRALLANALYAVLRPLARMAIRHGLTARDFHDIVKKAFVDIAREEYGLRGRPTNKARIATLSGLTRSEVSRLIELGEGVEAPALGTRHPLNRVVTRWLQPPWSDARGEPRRLGAGEGAASFAELVRDVGCDLPYQTLLRELARLQVVAVEGDAVRLLKRAFVPGGGDEADRLPFLAENAGALLDTIDHNLRSAGADRRFERKVAFPGLDARGLQRLGQIAAQDGQQLLERINDELTPHAVSPERQNGAGRLTGLGIYLFDLNSVPGGPFA